MRVLLFIAATLVPADWIPYSTRLTELSQLLTGDISVSNGTVTIAAPSKFTCQQTNLTANQIAALGSSPQTIITAQSSKIVFPTLIVINYTFGTAAFSGAVNIQARYPTGAIQITPNVNSDSFFTAASGNTVFILTPSQAGASSIGVVNGSMVGQGVTLFASADMTKGTATGTAVITACYQVITP